MAAAGRTAAKGIGGGLGIAAVDYYEAQKTTSRGPWVEQLTGITSGSSYWGGNTVTYCNAVPTARTFTAADLNQ